MAVVAVAVLVVQAGIARLRRKTIRKTVSSGVTRRRDVSRGKPAEFSRVLRVFAERRLPAFISAAASSASLRFGLHLPQHSLSLSLSRVELAWRRKARNARTGAIRINLCFQRSHKEDIITSLPAVTVHLRRIPSPSRMRRVSEESRRGVSHAVYDGL